MYAQPHMLPIRLGARLRPWLLGYLGLVYVVLCALGVHLLAVGRNWPLGDWQTNYEGGFVRRGFLGEIFLVVGRLLHVDPLYFAVAMSLLCYGLLLFTLASLLRQGAMQGWVILLIVSPATLLFPLLSTRAGFHKEVLYFAALSALVLLYRNGRKLPAVPVAAGLSVVAVVLLLSHEPIAFFLPYCIAVLFVVTGDAGYVLRVCAVPAALSASAFLLAAHYTGSPHIVQAICASVHADAAHPCSEAITYLVEDRAGARAMVQQNIAELHYYRHYPSLLLLALLPVILGVHALWKRPSLHRQFAGLGWLTFCAAVASVTLFRYGSDWGRWIHIHIVSLTLLLLWMNGTTKPSSIAPPVMPWSRGKQAVAALLTLGYATCWSIPGFGQEPLFGLLGLAVGIMHHHHR